jgi:hypothetical protein
MEAGDAAVRKRAYFDSYWGTGWPDLKWLERYFLAPAGERWTFETGNDGGSLTAEGIDGTGHLAPGDGRIDLHLTMLGNPDHGVLLQYLKLGGGENYYSRGNLDRLYDRVETLHGDLMPIGLHISFENAWTAVKEFIERDGGLPRSIEWIASKDLPKDVFPAQ